VRGRPHGRWRPGDLGLLVGGLALLVVSALPVEAGQVPAPEAGAFRAVNDVAWLPHAPVWVLMQMGNVLVVPASALGALVARRTRLAGSLFGAGAVAYLAAKVVKRFVTRGRPATLLADVHLRGAPSEGLGFVSGHAAVVTALALVAAPYLGSKGRALAFALALLVCLARVHVGAHLPLDVIGGAALGAAVAGLVRSLLPGRPDPAG
jgi:membrane-associated phospholipid phosphatase